MQNLKIYDIIDQLEDLIENSPKPKLSGSATKRTVDVEEVLTFWAILRPLFRRIYAGPTAL